MIDTSAFPSPGRPGDGLTKREYFAAAIMQGLMANPHSSGPMHDFSIIAVEQADSLLKVLSK